MVIVSIDEGKLHAVWVDGYIPKLSYVKEKAAGFLSGKSTKARNCVRHEEFEPRPYIRDDLFYRYVLKYEWISQEYDRYHDIEDYYLFFDRKLQRHYPQIWREYVHDEHKRSLRALIGVRERGLGAWNAETARIYLESCGFQIKDRGYLNELRFTEEAKQVLWMALAPWRLPCILAENLLKSSGFTGGHTNTLDVSDEQNRIQLDTDWY